MLLTGILPQMPAFGGILKVTIFGKEVDFWRIMRLCY
jgi:hypothetical protein